MKSIKPTLIREHDMEALYEVLSWYEESIYNKVLEKIIDMKSVKWNYYDPKGCDRLIEELSKTTLTDEIFEVFAIIMVTECIGHINYERERDWKVRFRADKATEIEISNYLWDAMGYKRAIRDELMYYIMTADFESFFPFALKYADVPLGEMVEELFEKLFDAKYMYFDSMETHYVIADIIKESDNCVLGCNHMG